MPAAALAATGDLVVRRRGTRTVTPSVPVRVDYELTPMGESLADVMGQIKTWAEQHMPEVDRARAEYDAR